MSGERVAKGPRKTPKHSRISNGYTYIIYTTLLFFPGEDPGTHAQQGFIQDFCPEGGSFPMQISEIVQISKSDNSCTL